MRCNRKTACFAVTPRKRVVDSLNITDIWQLRRREKIKAKTTKIISFSFQIIDNQCIILKNLKSEILFTEPR